LSALAAIGLHGLLFVAFVRFVPLNLLGTPEFTGPIAVTIGEYEEPAPGVQTAGAREGQPAERKAESVPNTAAVEKTTTVRSAEVSRESSSMKVEETPVPQEPRWGRPPARVPEESDRSKVMKNLAPVPSERPADEAATPKLAAPVTTEKSEIKPPLKPGIETSEAPMALPLQKLDDTLGKAIRGAESSGMSGNAATSPVQGKAGSGKQTSPATAGDGKKGAASAHGPSGSPDISWEIVGVQRSLRSPIPPLDPEIVKWVQREGIDPKVVVSFTVDAGGLITQVETAVSSGYTEFDSAVHDVVRKIKFKPVPGAAPARGKLPYVIRTK
jgi:TonB family protein